MVPISNGNILLTEEFAEKWKYSDGEVYRATPMSGQRIRQGVVMILQE